MIEIIKSLFDLILINPTTNALLFFNFIFTSVGIPASFGLAIIALTVAVRLVVHPFAKEQISLARKMEDLKPHLDKINEKHKNDKKKLQEEQMRLYKEMGVNPASGCLYALVQIPIFIALYNVLNNFLGKGGIEKISTEINKIVYFDFLKITTIDPQFFGFNIAVAPNQFATHGLHYLTIPVITGILQYYQIKHTTPQTKSSPKDKKKGDDMQVMMGKQMQLMFPLMIGYFSFVLPVGLALYWNIFSLFSILQYRKKTVKINNQDIKKNG